MLRMKRISITDRDGRAEDRSDGNLSFICYTFYGMGLFCEQFRRYLYGIENRIYVHMEEPTGIYLSTEPPYHK